MTWANIFPPLTASMFSRPLPRMVQGELQPLVAKAFERAERGSSPLSELHALAELAEPLALTLESARLSASVAAARRTAGLSQVPFATPYEWLSGPRIPSTYHGVAALLVAGLDVSKVLGDEWTERTLSWIRSLLTLEGMAVESDCPTSISPSLTAYALGVFHLLGGDAKPYAERFVKKWLKVNASNLRGLPLSDVAASVRMAASFLVPQPWLDRAVTRAFVSEVRREDGWTEFSEEIWAAYRADGTPRPRPIHSTLNALWLVRALGLEEPQDVATANVVGAAIAKGDLARPIPIKDLEILPTPTAIDALAAVRILQLLSI